MTYQQALDYLFSQLPMFHRIGAPAYKANLDNTIALSKVTGYPYNHFRTIHVAGTNGKGSVSHMLASICQESGLKTGLFTSPHLVDFRERMKVNGEMIPTDYITQFVEQYMQDFDRIKPSFFEMTFVMAMKWFHDIKVDIAIVETGLGGRLDSTNVITPVLSVITNIGYDHMQFLGNTLPQIASEKAGIIKPGIPVVIGESNPETEEVFMSRAKDCGSLLLFADKQIKTEAAGQTIKGNTLIKVIDSNSGEPEEYTVESALHGDYQLKNVATVLACMSIPGVPVSESDLPSREIILKGIRNTVINTGLQGRWQILSQSPLTVCDIGHNTHGIPWVVNQIKRQHFSRLHFVLGVVNDKDIDGMLEMLPQDAVYYFCKADIPRGLDAGELKKLADEKGLKGASYPSVESAYKAAEAVAKGDDMIFIGGSAFVVAEVIPLFSHL